MTRDHDGHTATPDIASSCYCNNARPTREEPTDTAAEIELVHVIAEATDGKTAWANRVTNMAALYETYDHVRDFAEKCARTGLAREVPEGLPITIRTVRETLTFDDTEED